MRNLIVAVSILLLAALVGCASGSDEAAVGGFAPNQESVAYAYTHGGYVGRAVVTTDAEGNLSAELNEAFLPHTLAEVDIESADWNEENTATYISREEPVYVARHISYDGTNYVGVTVGPAMIYVQADDSGNPDLGVRSGQDLEQIIIDNQATMANYYDVIEAGGFQVFTEFGGSPIAVTASSYGGLTKADGGYWAFGELGWQGNMDAIEGFVAENGAAGQISDMVRGDDNFWSVADATSGATASDFPDYFGLVQAAVGRLELN